MFSLNFMSFCSLIEELCTKEENYKTSCNFNFGLECIFFTSVLCSFKVFVLPIKLYSFFIKINFILIFKKKFKAITFLQCWTTTLNELCPDNKSFPMIFCSYKY